MDKTLTPSAQDDSLQRYYQEVSGVTMLTAKEERTLILEYQASDTPKHIKDTIKDRIIKGALKFVISEARKQPKARKDRAALQDLIAAGNVGLLRALNKFDVTQGTRFLTYAGWWVRHEMREENKHLSICHIPTHAMSKGISAPAAVELTENSLAAEDTDADVQSTDNTDMLRQLLNIAALNTHETYIVKSCYGIDTQPKTLRQVGKVLVITGERVRQLRETALSKLRASADAGNLDLY